MLLGGPGLTQVLMRVIRENSQPGGKENAILTDNWGVYHLSHRQLSY